MEMVRFREMRLCRNFKKIGLSLHDMNFFHRFHLQKYVTLVIGLIFLNLSFFQTELTCLEIAIDKKSMIENLVRMIAGTSEEENDAANTEKGPIVKEVDLFVHHQTNILKFGYTLIANNYHLFTASQPQAGNFETRLQPPEA
jgi:hypothetical protein